MADPGIRGRLCPSLQPWPWTARNYVVMPPSFKTRHTSVARTQLGLQRSTPRFELSMRQPVRQGGCGFRPGIQNGGMAVGSGTVALPARALSSDTLPATAA